MQNIVLTHWGPVTFICVSNLTILSSDNGLSPGRRQAIIWSNAGKVLLGPLGINFSDILIEFHTFSFKKMHLKSACAKLQPFVSASMHQGLNISVHCPNKYEADMSKLNITQLRYVSICMSYHDLKYVVPLLFSLCHSMSCHGVNDTFWIGSDLNLTW